VKPPERIEDVTREWLTSALSEKFPGTEVLHVTFGGAKRATGTKIRLLLEYNDAGHRHRLPPTMWFKGGYEPHTENVRTSHARESLFYSEIEPLKLVNSPACYYASISDSGDFGVQLIEDLLQRNAWFGDARNPVPLATVRDGLKQLARLHAHWWKSPELDRLGPVGGSLATDGIVLKIMGKRDWGNDGSGDDVPAWERAMEKDYSRDVPEALRHYEAAVAGMERLWELDRQSNNLCMVHGDAHPGNLFFEQDGTPGFLDWQRLMQSDWGHDVAYFVIGCMDMDESARHEESLLRGYLEELESQGVRDLDWDQAWLSYRRHAMYGLVWNTVPPVMQPPEVCELEALRFNAAVKRLETHDALFND
jgi:hypothetical protein